MRIVFLGLSITSSWGNGHATNYRALVSALTARGHEVLFLERNRPWYEEHRDLPVPPAGRTELYTSLAELRERFGDDVEDADLVVVGSYVPEGVAVGEWVTEHASGLTAFWDIDTPVTVAKLESGDHEYLSRELVPRFDLYLSFTGGPLLRSIEHDFGARCALPFYCMADPEVYRPLDVPTRWTLGYLGTYSADRQATLDALLRTPAELMPEARFVVAGPQYPPDVEWPENVERIEHLAPGDHAAFYAAQELTLNVTRDAMVRAGWSPSVRLFEAAACGVPAISDWWDGLGAFFEPGLEILVARDTDEVVRHLRSTSADERREIGARARSRVVAEHTPTRRAEQLESYVCDLAAVA
ncbi:MAG: glycosyltransferase [Gaiellaceae bacterium]|jgi:spore maturation protein CgeB